MADLLPTLTKLPQSGFVKGRSAVSNIRKVISVLEYAIMHPKEDIAIISLEEAFDNIAFKWLFQVLVIF